MLFRVFIKNKLIGNEVLNTSCINNLFIVQIFSDLLFNWEY